MTTTPEQKILALLDIDADAKTTAGDVYRALLRIENRCSCKSLAYISDIEFATLDEAYRALDVDLGAEQLEAIKTSVNAQDATKRLTIIMCHSIRPGLLGIEALTWGGSSREMTRLVVGHLRSSDKECKHVL